MLEALVYENDNSTLLAVLDGARKLAFRQELMAPGSGSFEIHADDAKATSTNLQYGNIVRVRYNGSDVFAFVIERREETLVDGGEEGSRLIQISGRGLLALLDYAVVYPSSLANVYTVERSFASKSLAYIFKTLLDEAQARGWSGLTETFSTTTTTPGSPQLPLLLTMYARTWADSHTFFLRAGMTLLDVALQFQDLGGIAFEASPDGDLNAYATIGSDKSGNVRLRAGLNILNARRSGSAINLANAMVGEGQYILDEDTDATSISDYGRRETYVQIRNVNSSSELAAFNAAYIGTSADPVETLELVVTETPTPWLDYVVGDTVQVIIPGGGINTGYRIRALTAEQQDDGTTTLTLDVNSRRAEYLEEVNRMLRNFQMGRVGSLGAPLAKGNTDRKFGGWSADRDKLYNGTMEIDATNKLIKFGATAEWRATPDETGLVTDSEVYAARFEAENPIGNSFFFGVQIQGTATMQYAPYLNYTHGSSSKDPTTDAPAAWAKFVLNGTTYYFPGYTAS